MPEITLYDKVIVALVAHGELDESRAIEKMELMQSEGSLIDFLIAIAV